MLTKNVFEKYTTKETFEKIVDYSCLAEMWEHSVKNYSSNIAVIDQTEYTYSELDELISNFRGVLYDHNIKKGDIVGIYLPNSVDFVKAFLAVTTYGACAVLLPPHLDSMSLFGCSMKYGLNAIVYSPMLKENLTVVTEKISSVCLIDSTEKSVNSQKSVDVNGDVACAVLFTGGTTGKSKGARLSHRAVIAGIKNGCYGLNDVFEQRYFLILPLTHVFGLIRNFLTAMYTGSSMFICKNNKDMFRDIAVYKPTVMILVPALAEMALNLSKQFGKNMLGSDIKYIICGAAAVAPYLVTEYHKLGVTLLPGYGLTESANLVSGNPEAIRKPDSVGLMYPGMDYKIVNGELWLKGVNMMDGYVGDEENETAYSEDGYFKTGDLVKIDDEGFLYIIGRIKEIIVLSTGENISPAEIESLFYGVDEIQDCMVYSDIEDGKEILAIEILPRMTAIKAMNISDIAVHIRWKVDEINSTLPTFKRINKVVIRDSDFIRSPSMKIVRNKNGNKK